MALCMYVGFSSCWLVPETMNLCVKEIARATILEILLCDLLTPVFCVCDGSEGKNKLAGSRIKRQWSQGDVSVSEALAAKHKDGVMSQRHH